MKNILAYFMIFLLFSCVKKQIDSSQKKDYQGIFTIDYNKDNKDKYIKGLNVYNYVGEIHDSIDISRIKYIGLASSFILGDKKPVFDSVLRLHIYNSTLYDSTFNLNHFPKLEYLVLKDNLTQFIIEDSLPIKNLLLGVYMNQHGVKSSKVDATKLYALDSILIECEECEVTLPNKKLKRMGVFTNKIDTFYNNPPSIFSDDNSTEQRE